MRTREEKIKLLEQVIKGELPASVLKVHRLTYFHCFDEDQSKQIEAKLGSVAPGNCSQYHPHERIAALWDGLPIGITGLFHFPLFKHQDCNVEVIDCRDEQAFNALLLSLPQKELVLIDGYQRRVKPNVTQ